MNVREKAIEIITYIFFSSIFLIITPAIAKYLDFLILKTNYLLAPYPYMIIIGVLIAISGLFLVLCTIYLFKRFGDGTPNPAIPPKKLVIKGPYKIVRNPMALGGAILLAGEVLIYYSLCLFVLTVIYVIILYFNAMLIEEPGLKKRFGNEYEKYLKEVPRFFPSVRLRRIR